MEDVKRKIWIKTYGCQMNMRDSKTLKAMLLADGHILVDDEKAADLVLLNTCSIRDLAESKAIGKAGRLLKNKRKNPHYRVGILGCMASRQKEQLLKILPELDWIIPSQNLSEVPELIKNSLQNQISTCIVANTSENFDFRCYERPIKTAPSLFVPIQQGCNMHCSYCIVPKTRGAQQNRPLTSILKEVNKAVNLGTKEIFLIGQIVNSYRDKTSGKTFTDLLKDINAIKGVERIRFMSPHPSFFNDELIQCFSMLEKLCPSIHLPVQSGSNYILKQMHRAYTRERILEIVQTLRAIQPQSSISTDIIVGYPGESKSDFENTVELFDTVKFDMAYIFKYSPRPTTLAAPQQDTSLGIPEDVKEARNQRLLQQLTIHSTNYNRQFLGTTQKVLVEGKAPHGNKLFGKNIFNKKVIFSGPNTWIGSLKNILIKKASSSVLEGIAQ